MCIYHRYLICVCLFSLFISGCKQKYTSQFPPTPAHTPWDTSKDPNLVVIDGWLDTLKGTEWEVKTTPTATPQATVTPIPTPIPSPTATPTPKPTPEPVYIKPAIVELPRYALSGKGYQLILDFEVGGGKQYYDRYLARPSWPGASSGVTIGVGYDLGYNSRNDILTDWRRLGSDAERLADVNGATGARARGLVSRVRDILIKWDDAEQVFNDITINKFILLTKRAYPHFDELHADAQAVLVSISFNRGTSMVGDRRRELRSIKDLVPQKDYKGMAAQIRAMKRLWVGQGVDGLLRRREAEARMMESCK
jgi:hypothetical protein